MRFTRERSSRETQISRELFERDLHAPNRWSAEVGIPPPAMTYTHLGANENVIRGKTLTTAVYPLGGGNYDNASTYIAFLN